MNDPQIVITTNHAVIARIQKLVDTGLYGRSVEDAAERLLCEAVRMAIVPYEEPAEDEEWKP